jgi:hypothetical protein
MALGPKRKGSPGRVMSHKLKHFRGGVAGAFDEDIKGAGFQNKARDILTGTIPDLGLIIPG